MPSFKVLQIDNSKDAAVHDGKWKNPGAKFYDDLMNAMYSKDGKIPDDSESLDDKIKRGDICFHNKLLKEAYLIAPVEKIKNSPYGRTPFSRSGCKYPHHVIRDGTLVLSVPGIKAAYARAKQQGIFKGSVKEHLERHYKELCLYDESSMNECVNITDIIEQNFTDIQTFIEDTLDVSFDEPFIESTSADVNSIEEGFDWIDSILYQSDDEYNESITNSHQYIHEDGDETSSEENKNGSDDDQKSEESEEAPNIELDEDEESTDDNQVKDISEEDESEPAPNIIEPTSLPKIADANESDKNGVRRKKLYIAFIEWAKKFNPRNTFGSIFDKDAFDVTYPFVPHEMRYFYRLANPILCVLSGKLTFFQVSELKKLNADNPDIKDALIFAATEKDYRVFSTRDKKVYLGEDKPDGKGIQFTKALGDTFDLYIQNMINQGDILNGPIEDKTNNDPDNAEE